LAKAETGKEHQFRVAGSATHQDRVWRQKTQPIHLTLTAPEPESSQAELPKTTHQKPDSIKAANTPAESKSSTDKAKP
jgi:hypothetical protein